MKKTISWLAVSVFLIAGLAFMAMAQADDSTDATSTPTLTSVDATASVTTVNLSDGELEKIDSPEQLKDFKVMKRIGNTLYGVRTSVLNQLRKDGHANNQEKVMPTTSVGGQPTNSNDGELEKIESPEQLKEFKVMKRVGNTLYGIRISVLNQLQKNKATSTAISQGNVLPSSSQGNVSSSNQLEKIAAPQLIHLYEKIKKVGNALWGVKRGDNQQKNINPSEHAMGSLKPDLSQKIDSQPIPFIKITEEMRACVKKAIVTKDDAIISKIMAAAESLKSAITTRGTCQIVALKTTGDQETAVKSCANVFQETQKKINIIAQQSQKEAWTDYNRNLQACRPNVNPSIKIDASTEISSSTPATSEDQGQIMIEDGGNNEDVQVFNN